MRINQQQIIAKNTDPPIEAATPLSGLYLRFLENEQPLSISPGLQAVSYEYQDNKLVEIKGLAARRYQLEIPQERPTFWLLFQLLGKTSLDDLEGSSLNFLQYQSYLANGNTLRLEVEPNKVWLLLIGISGQDLTRLQQEYPLLPRNELSTERNSTKAPLPINYYQKRILDSFQKIAGGSYSTPVNIAFQTCRLLQQYHSDLSHQQERRDPAEISLYHRAVAYIQQHYMDEDINRHRIAEELHISLRTLHRLFENRNTKISTAIQIARLFKARELLWNTTLSIEEIAFVFHFTDAQHFSRAYALLFKCKPTDDRKKHRS